MGAPLLVLLRDLRLPLLMGLWLLLATGPATAVRAQPVHAASQADWRPVHTGDEDSARVAFAQGLDRARDARWSEALVAFRRSMDILPRARTLYNIVVALDELGRGAECVETIDALLGRRDLDAVDRRAALELADHWRPRLAMVTLDLSPPVAKVLVDGRDVRGDGPIWLDPGQRRLRFEAEGFVPEELIVDAVAGADRTIEVMLARAVAPPIRAVEVGPAPPGFVEVLGVFGAERRGGLGGVQVNARRGGGVMIRPGWLLTSHTLVVGADRLIVQRGAELRGASVVWSDATTDLALVSTTLQGPVARELARSADLSSPLEVSGVTDQGTAVRWSARLASAPVGIQPLAVHLPDGALGGPVLLAGQVYGVATRVQGVWAVTPVASFFEQLRLAMDQPQPTPHDDPNDVVVAELSGLRSAPTIEQRLARLVEASREIPTDARAALWAIEADSVGTLALARGQEALLVEVSRLEARFAMARFSDPSLSARYGLQWLADGRIRPGAFPRSASTLMPEPLPGEPAGTAFSLGAGLGLVLSDRTAADGVMVAVRPTFFFGAFGGGDPVRFDLLLGAELGVGPSAGEVAAHLLAMPGFSLEVGSREAAFALQGTVVAGWLNRMQTDGAVIGGRAAMGVRHRGWCFLLAYRHAHYVVASAYQNVFIEIDHRFD